MSLLRAQRAITLPELGIVRGRGPYGAVQMTDEMILRHSGVWASIRLRANVISMMPANTFRRFDGVDIKMPNAPVLDNPDGGRGGMPAWMWASQYDLDRYGNCFGIITARDGNNLPKQIILESASRVTVKVRGTQVYEYVIAGRPFAPEDVWHEVQFQVPGLAVGLSPIAHAAYSISTYLSAQQFALDWFASGGAPTGHFRNTVKQTMSQKEARLMKERFKAAVQDRDVLVTGSDWEYNMQAVPMSETMFLEQMKYGLTDIARFLDVPGDMIEAPSSGSSITYANVTQRNLQLLVMNLQPAINRREWALSQLTANPRYVKLDTDTLLRMDPQTRADMLGKAVTARILAPSEARSRGFDLPPFTPEQLAEFDTLFGPQSAPGRLPTPANPGGTP